MEEEKKKAELQQQTQEEERVRTQTAEVPIENTKSDIEKKEAPSAPEQMQKEHVEKENRVEISVNEDLASALSEVDYFLTGATSAAAAPFNPPDCVEDAAGSGSAPQNEPSAVSEEEVLFQADPASGPPSPGGVAGAPRKKSPEKKQSTIL